MPNFVDILKQFHWMHMNRLQPFIQFNVDSYKFASTGADYLFIYFFNSKTIPRKLKYANFCFNRSSDFNLYILYI